MKTPKNITTIAALTLALALGAFAFPASAAFPVDPVNGARVLEMSRAERNAALVDLGYPGARLMRDARQIKILLKAEQEKAQASVASQAPRYVPTKKGSPLNDAIAD